MKKFSGKVIIALIALVLILSIPVSASIQHVARGQQVQFFSPVTIEANETVNGDVVTFFSSAEIHGQVNGDVVGIFSHVEISRGHVNGDVVSVLQSVSLHNAHVQGDVVSVLGGVHGSGNSQINGDAIAVMGQGLNLNDTTVLGSHIDVLGGMPINISGFGLLATLLAIFFVVKQILAFALGVIAIVVFPERFERMAAASFDDVGRKTLVGLLVYGGAWVLLVILVVSVVGAPLLSILIPSFMLLEFGANTTMKIAFGQKMARGMGKNWGSIAELFLGTLLFVLLEITIVGKVFTFLFKLMGLGQIVDSRFGDFTMTEEKGETHATSTS